MRGPSLGRVLVSGELLGALLFAFATGFPPLEATAEVDLTLHMTQHILVILAGVFVAYPHIGRGLLKTGGRGWVSEASLAASVLLIVFWHLPGPWDGAVINPGVHALEHLSFLLVGLLSGSWLMLLSDSGKIGALMAAFFGHMGYAVLLVWPRSVQVYSLYSVQNQATLGWALLLTGPSLIVGVAYVIARNPDWLGGSAGSVSQPRPKRETFLNRTKVKWWAAPVLSLALASALVGYFAVTAYAIGATNQSQIGEPNVYILETPVSWQFSPQNTRIVLGHNATVTWISRSFSYDTVTSRTGAFNSGPIAPGGGFTFTFSRPGVYDYYCQFHPWMSGTVTVVQAS